MRTPFIHSLRFRLIASVVLIEVVMLSIMVWSNVNSIYHTHTERLKDTANSLLQQFAKTAGNYLVEVDYAGLEDYAASVLQHREIAYIIVHGLHDNAVVEKGAVPEGEHPQADADPKDVTDGIYDVGQDIRIGTLDVGHVRIGFTLAVMNEAIREARNRSVLIASTEILLTVLVTIFLGMRLTRDIRSLSDAAYEVERGNYNVTLPLKRKDELGLTAHAFNSMVREIDRRARLVQESEEWIRLLLNCTEEGIYGVDLEGNCTFVNRACVRMLGYQQASDLVGQSIHELIHHSYPDGTPYPQEQCQVRLATLKGESGHSDQEVHWRADGTSFPVEYWSHPIIHEGNTVGTVVTFIDITQRKLSDAEISRHRSNLQELVDERTSELASVNRELEAFSYSVSHDLRAPLRAIDGFSLALLEDYADSVSVEAKEYIVRVRNAAQRMGQLIDDLLLLARLSRSDMHIERIDLSKMANEIIEALREANPERKVQVNIQPGVMVMADRKLFKVVMENLLGNAWKYTSKKPEATIDFYAQEIDGETQYVLRDNGAGFDMAYADKMFGAFQRLHGVSEFEGTGVGLATVQRIINRHHGRIWAEGEPGQGARFYFVVPE